MSLMPEVEVLLRRATDGLIVGEPVKPSDLEQLDRVTVELGKTYELEVTARGRQRHLRQVYEVWRTWGCVHPQDFDKVTKYIYTGVMGSLIKEGVYFHYQGIDQYGHYAGTCPRHGGLRCHRLVNPLTYDDTTRMKPCQFCGAQDRECYSCCLCAKCVDPVGYAKWREDNPEAYEEWLEKQRAPRGVNGWLQAQISGIQKHNSKRSQMEPVPVLKEVIRRCLADQFDLTKSVQKDLVIQATKALLDYAKRNQLHVRIAMSNGHVTA